MPEKLHQPVVPPTAPFPTDLRANLTDAERAMYNAVLDHFSKADYTIPELDNGSLTEAEKFWLSYECILRCAKFYKLLPSRKEEDRL